MEDFINSLKVPTILLFIAIIITIAVLIMRWVGAWMLRINEVIKTNKSILKELQIANGTYKEPEEKEEFIEKDDTPW